MKLLKIVVIFAILIVIALMAIGVKLIFAKLIFGERISEKSITTQYQRNKTEMEQIRLLINDYPKSNDERFHIQKNSGYIQFSLFTRNSSEDITDAIDPFFKATVEKLFKNSKFTIIDEDYGNCIVFETDNSSLMYYNGIVIVKNDDEPDCAFGRVTKLVQIDSLSYYFEAE